MSRLRRESRNARKNRYSASHTVLSTKSVQNDDKSVIFFIICKMIQQGGCVYIMTNKMHTALYVGVSSDITGRVWQHKNKFYPNSFTAKYNCNKLVYYCFYPRIEEAIAVEDAIKGGNRKSKINLVNSINPQWLDLYDDLIRE